VTDTDIYWNNNNTNLVKNIHVKNDSEDTDRSSNGGAGRYKQNAAAAVNIAWDKPAVLADQV
jgi:hypothetical protein